MADEEEDTDTGDSPDLEEYLEGITKRFYISSGMLTAKHGSTEVGTQG